MTRSAATPLRSAAGPAGGHRRRVAAREPFPGYVVGVPGSVVVDTNVLIDILNDHPVWAGWSAAQIAPLIAERRAILLPIVFAELAAGFATQDALERALSSLELVREPLSWEGAFLAGKAYTLYRKRGGAKRSPLPDFYVGAHALSGGHALLTRDPQRYREYFPKLKVIAPK